MRRLLLGLVVFVLYLCVIPAQVDSEQTTILEVKYPDDILTDLNNISNLKEKAKWKKHLYRMFATGHTMGYAIAEGLTFLDSFLCATHGLKEVLEEAYGYTVIPQLPPSSDYLYLEIPKDNDNDEWVRKYNYRINQANIPSTSTTPKNYFDIILAFKPLIVGSYVGSITESFINWYKLLTFVFQNNSAPGFIKDLRSLLIEFKEKNEAKYKSIDEVHVRFAAHMARSYIMMSALHHQLGNYLKSYAEQHKEMNFSEILFKFAPTWHMSEEQFQFLNILRQTLPDKLKSLKHVFFQHNNKWIIFPYDNSDDCGRLKLHELPTIPANMDTFASVVATSTVAASPADPPH